MKQLSFSTMNALINCPHTWLCKNMGLKTFTTKSFEDGKKAHRIIQDHVSGVKEHPLLKNLPEFIEVETTDFDQNMKIVYKYDDEYEIIGYVDAKDVITGQFLEIKSGKTWSMADFARLPQWKIYALALPEYERVWFANVPITPDKWNKSNVRIFNAKITDVHKQEARKFIEKAIYTIDHIGTLMEGVEPQPRNRSCFYIGCPWCIDYEKNM